MVATDSLSSRFNAVPFGTSEVRPEQSAIPFVLAAAMLAVSFGPVGSGQALVVLTFSAFLFVSRSATWALVPVIATELTVADYRIPLLGTSQRLTVVALAAILTATLILRQYRQHDPNFQRVLIPSVLLLIVGTLVDAMTTDTAYTIKYARYESVQILALILAASVIRTRKDLLLVALSGLSIAFVAAVATIWQHYARFSAPVANLDAAAVLPASNGRAIGLSVSPVSLGIQLALVLATLLGYLVCAHWKMDRTRFLLIVSVVVLTLGLNFSYTRSALFALAPALAAMGLCLRGHHRTFLLSTVIVGVLLFQGLQGTGLIGARYYKNASNDQSAASHQALWQADLHIALNNPFVGIGHQAYEAVAAHYANQAGTPVGAGDQALGKERPHNDFLNVWLSWGILALIAYLAIFVGTLRNLYTAIRHPDPLIRGLAVGGIGAIAAYAVHSAYHNTMDSSLFLWMYAGFSVSLARIAAADASRYRRRVMPRISLPELHR